MLSRPSPKVVLSECINTSADQSHISNPLYRNHAVILVKALPSAKHMHFLPV